MQYYRIRAEHAVLEGDLRHSFAQANRESWKAATNEIMRTTHDEVFMYTESIASTYVVLGLISSRQVNPSKILESYLGSAGWENLTNISINEGLYREMRSSLQRADANDYIDNDEEIMEHFCPSLFNRFGSRLSSGCSENCLPKYSRKDLLAAMNTSPMKEDLETEMNRIYADGNAGDFRGHPVHYTVMSDDKNLQQDVCRLLMCALYDNSRLYSAHYFFAVIDCSTDPGEMEIMYRAAKGGTVILRYDKPVEDEEEYASEDRGIVERIGGIIKKYRKDVLTILCFPRECTQLKGIFSEYLDNMTFVEIKETLADVGRAKEILKIMAKENKVRTDKKLFRELEEGKTYLYPDLRRIFEEWYDTKLKTTLYPQYKELDSVKQETAKAKPKGSAYEELMEMVGLEEAKKVIINAVNYNKAMKVFASKGMQKDVPTMHMVFTGNPGTAKTSVARLFARIMRENEVLSCGDLVEVGRADLVGKYVGWTAQIVKKKFEEAEGSVLFIDEAYSLVDGSNSFGDEAINTIVQEMENHRNDVVVIFAGYPDKMEAFLEKNPGLRSRIAYHVPFDDYDTENLCEITTLIAKKKGLTLTEDAYDKLRPIFDEAKAEPDFGNGRFVRNIIEKAKMAQATRLLERDPDDVTAAEISTITAADIDLPKPKQTTRKPIGFGAA